MTELKPWTDEERAGFRIRLEACSDFGYARVYGHALVLLDLYEAALNDIKLLGSAFRAELGASMEGRKLLYETLERDRELEQAAAEFYEEWSMPDLITPEMGEAEKRLLAVLGDYVKERAKRKADEQAPAGLEEA